MVAVVVLAGFAPACGAEGDGASLEDAPFLDLSEVESVIARGELELVRTGGRDDHASLEDAAPLVDGARYESQSGREFDVLVFRSERDAKRASRSLVEGRDGASAIRAANVVAVFPEPFSEVDAYRAAARAMRRLAMACSGQSANDRLRRPCFDDGGGVPPPGAGVDRQEAEGQERPVVVGGLHYDPVLARRLNVHIEPDSELLAGRRPDPGKAWFGVFVRVCNRTDATRTPSEKLALVDAFGAHLQPSDALPASNPFSYRPRPIAPDDCLPAPGSVAARVSDGALVLFEISTRFLRNRPVALQVTGADGRHQRVIIDP